ncbi:acyl-CoA dehydrogenase family protein [Lacticaseibacillus paracasei]|uniref:acyl-CoA dehydrogenase family protein n=1 Tax=Lacticaseibacillus paracasei TaxID=1597 RepID=UPI000E206713|nr:acyl-CoA dehydrogenase family protein [Lacticaseibacillus paracasei]RDV40291.1 acyl-CoA dehydrogenase [Lacticaseibacillus paracasei subsp. paracasei]
MQRKWTEAEQMLLRMTATYTDQEIAPYDMAMANANHYPDGLIEKLIETGFLTIMLPKTYGGADFGPEVTAAVVERVAQGSASVAVTLEGHYKSVEAVMRFGTPALKAALLPQAAKRIFAFGMTEPTGGSNHLGIQSTAVKQGDGWLLNGNKIMITNGGLAEVYCVLAKTGEQELSVFVVDKDMPGVQFGKQENFIGLRGTPVGEIFMTDVWVDDDHLLGKIGEGRIIGDQAHDDARILMGAVLSGITQHALTLAVQYANERTALGAPIGQLQAIQRKLADIATAHEINKLLYEHVVYLKASGQSYTEEAAIAKAHGSRAAVKACDDALQIYAGYGYSRDFPLAHLITDARALEIAEGTVEKMRTAIALSELAKEAD